MPTITRALSTIFLLLTASLLFGSANAAAASNADQQRYIVTLRSGAEQQPLVAAQQAAGNKVSERFTSRINGFVVNLSAAERRQLAAAPQVAIIEPDRRVQINAARDSLTSLWNLDRLDQRALPGNGRITTSTNGAGVSAYIIDTGIKANHAQFAGRVRGTGFTAISDGQGFNDCEGHGTHVAGTVAGKDYGVAPGATLVAVRTLDCQGEGWLSDVVAGMDWVVADHQSGQPAVANMSLGGGLSSSLNSAVRRMVADGVTVVAAAGNDDSDACLESPGSEPQALTVGATTSSDQRSYFSNYGPCLDIFAPGSSILSAAINSTTDWIYQSGTSMAAPHVAGAVALLLEAEPALTPSQVASKIIANSTSGIVSDPGSGSANRFLYLPATDPPQPPPVNPELPTPKISGPDGQGMIFFTGANSDQYYLCAIGLGAQLQPCQTPYAPLGLSDGQHPYRLAIANNSGQRSVEIQGLLTISGAPVPPSDSSGATLPPGVAINGRRAFTKDPVVELNLSWPAGARKMTVVNRGYSFTSRQLTVSSQLFWSLSGSDGVKTVEVSFQGPGGADLGTYRAAITVDRRAPEVSSGQIISQRGNIYRLAIKARDAVSGLGQLQISTVKQRPAKALRARSIKYRKATIVNIESSRLPRWFRVADRAGNFSPWQRLVDQRR